MLTSLVLEEHEITCVINISRSRAPDTNDADYASRRAAVDFGIPVSLIVTLLKAPLIIAAHQQRQARCALHRDSPKEVPRQSFALRRGNQPL